MKRFLISLDDAIYEQIRLTAFNERKSISEVVREIIKRGMEDENKSQA